MLITIRNYKKGILGVIDKYPQFIAVCHPMKQELRLNNSKPGKNIEFNSFEEFEEYMKERKENEE